MIEFKKVEKLSLFSVSSTIIKKELEYGSHCIVYGVKIYDRLYALKCYTCKFKNKGTFRINLEINISIYFTFLKGFFSDNFCFGLITSNDKNVIENEKVVIQSPPDLSERGNRDDIFIAWIFRKHIGGNLCD